MMLFWPEIERGREYRREMLDAERDFAGMSDDLHRSYMRETEDLYAYRQDRIEAIWQEYYGDAIPT